MHHSIRLIVISMIFLCLVTPVLSALRRHGGKPLHPLMPRDFTKSSWQSTSKARSGDPGGIDGASDDDTGGIDRKWRLTADAERFRERGNTRSKRHSPSTLLKRSAGLAPRAAEAAPVGSGKNSPSVDWPHDSQSGVKAQQDDRMSGGARSFDVVDSGDEKWSHMTSSTRKSTEPPKSQKQTEHGRDRDEGQERDKPEPSESQSTAANELRTESNEGRKQSKDMHTEDSMPQGGQQSSSGVKGKKHAMIIGKDLIPEAFRMDALHSKAFRSGKNRAISRSGQNEGIVEEAASSSQRQTKTTAPILAHREEWQKLPNSQLTHREQSEGDREERFRQAVQKNRRKGMSLKDSVKLAQLLVYGMWTKMTKGV